MMRTKIFVLILAVFILFFQSCLPSLHPLYTADTIIVNDGILGTWLDSEGDFENITFLEDGSPVLLDSSRLEKYGGVSMFKFEKADKNSYQLSHFDDQGRVAKFDVYLIKLGDNYYMDFYPITETKDSEGGFSLNYEKFNSFEAWHYYPVHTFAKFTLEKGELSIELFDGEYLGDLIEQNRVRIKYEDTDHGTIFTASTKELQEFVLKYGSDKKLFMESSPLVKPS